MVVRAQAGYAHSTSPTMDSVEMRRAVGRFPTGVTVVTAMTAQGEPLGCTISAFCSLSLEPPLVLVCIGTERSMHDILTDTEYFVINVLAAQQRDLALLFAGRRTDRFAGLPVTAGPAGVPRLDGAVAQLDCRRHDILPGGDHAIVVGEVLGVTCTDGEPLLYADGDLRAEGGAPAST